MLSDKWWSGLIFPKSFAVERWCGTGDLSEGRCELCPFFTLLR